MGIWTPAALSSKRRRLAGPCWRIVEAQHRISTLKLVDTLAEQARLEQLLDLSKPPVPPECSGLHYLLSTPFRYGAPYPHGSRFRRPGLTAGVFYASAKPATAVAEAAFHRLLFFADSPATSWPDNPGEYTAFSVRYSTKAGLD
nr:RES family NAD+ phosphorylase [Acidobacteriota bacterium]